VLPVVKIGEQVIGDGTPGKITRYLERAYLEAIERELEAI
jgi:branched-subunit amino acid aminotransferase/4-amino-4-deoxychorismate lyase